MQATRWRVTMTGELDLDRRDQLGRALGDYLREDAADAEVDWRGVSFADSAGLRWLARLSTRARLRGGTVTVLGARPVVRRAAAVLGLTEQVTFRDA